MNEINAKLQEKLSKLEKGELELSELESLVQDARELYERLLIVKYKAYENYGEPPSKQEKVDEDKETPATQSGKIESDDSSIEEAIDFSSINEPEEQPSFDFSAIEESIEEVEETVENEIEEKADSEINTEKESETFPKSFGTQVQPTDIKSLNSQIQAGEDELSLRKKLQNTPISDLKSEISIAKKFEYITFMFDGKNEKYEAAIADLNGCANGEEAKNKLNEYSTEYDWDLENKSIIKFVELVERRYL